MKTDAPKTVQEVPLFHRTGQTQRACVLQCVRGFAYQLANPLNDGLLVVRSIQVPIKAESFADELRQELNRTLGESARIDVSLRRGNEVRCEISRLPPS